MPTEQELEKIQYHTNAVSGRFKSSYSGYLHSIVRKNWGNYKEPNPEIWGRIHTHFMQGERGYISGLEEMLTCRTADCWQQSLILGITLKHVEEINRNYRIFIASLPQRSPVYHTFLLLLSRNYFPEKLDPTFTPKPIFGISADILLDDKNVIAADPWRNLVFATGITNRVNPFNFIEDFDITSALVDLENLDLHYLATQNYFQRSLNIHIGIRNEKKWQYCDYKDILALSRTSRFFRDETTAARALIKQNNVKASIVASDDSSFKRSNITFLRQ